MRKNNQIRHSHRKLVTKAPEISDLESRWFILHVSMKRKQRRRADLQQLICAFGFKCNVCISMHFKYALHFFCLLTLVVGPILLEVLLKKLVKMTKSGTNNFVKL